MNGKTPATSTPTHAGTARKPAINPAPGGTSRRGGWAVIADLLVALMPLGGILVAYVIAAWINSSLSAAPLPGAQNALGFALHVTEPVAIDRAVFGVNPSAWLQQHLHPTNASNWWDAIFAVIYTSHFVAVPFAAIALWMRQHDRFRPFIWSVFALVAAGIILYIVYPMAPPWMAARDGYLEPTARLSGIGWQWLGLGFIDQVQAGGQTSGNTVAAMPSLHAGAAALLAALFWSGQRWAVRLLMSAYAALMAFTLVYAGEHYVIDVVVGILLGIVAVVLIDQFPAARGRSKSRDKVVRHPTRSIS